MASCKSCGAPIKWVQMKESGKAMPLDDKPLSVVVETEEGWVVKQARQSHFATCPDAAAHRKQ